MRQEERLAELGGWPESPGVLRHGSAPGVGRGLEELLRSLPDREDLERLYQRRVSLGQILRLLGHQVDPSQIEHLLRCEDPQREIRRILGSM